MFCWTLLGLMFFCPINEEKMIQCEIQINKNESFGFDGVTFFFKFCCISETLGFNIINRPGVAGAVL